MGHFRYDGIHLAEQWYVVWIEWEGTGQKENNTRGDFEGSFFAEVGRRLRMQRAEVHFLCHPHGAAPPDTCGSHVTTCM